MNKLLMILALTLPAAAFAGADAKYQLGTEARAWTDLQKSGRASLGAVRPMPGEVADKVYDRYLQSFGRPIPETFERESFVGAGRGGGSGGGSGGGK
jgi:hypothetical protein